MSQTNLQATHSLDHGAENPTITGSSTGNWGLWERLVPDQVADDPASQRILEIHQRRYETAARYAKNRRVLDIACGVGYGSKMLKLAGATSVVGVDLSPETLVYAREKHQAPGLQYICANAETFNWHESFDLIVSFETLEHLPNPDLFIERMSQLLAPGGYFLLSVPLGETRHLDAYHLHAFSEKDVHHLFEQAGFVIEKRRCDDWFLSRSELLHWQKIYPESQASLRKILFTQRGQKLIWDFVVRGGFHMPQLLIEARKSSELPKGIKQKILSLD